MDFRILGPLEVVEEGQALPLVGAKQRALLAFLVLNANRVVSTDRLIDALWGEDVLEGTAHTLQVHVSNLRKVLREQGGTQSLLATAGGGYVLRVAADAIDANRFERALADGRQALADGDPTEAASTLREALNMWRGPPLGEFAYEAFAQTEIARLEDLRLSAVEERVEAELALGRHAEIIAELQGQLAANPFRERLRLQLMLAMYRSGRQAEALKVYRDGREMLADELGIDPTPELRRLEQAILKQDPDLDLAPTGVRVTEPADAVAASRQPIRDAAPTASEPAGERHPARRERKFATALFADLVGSTALAEREDPEVVQSLVGRAFDRLANEIERYGGHTEKFVGDAVLALFGVPSAHEDDPERAVRAALDMQAVLSDLNGELATEGRPQLALRIGVEGGQVLVDLDRVAEARDRMITGDAVNTAARLQAAADPGLVVVGPTVFASVKDVFEFRELPALSLKGKAEPIQAWEVVRVKARRPGERSLRGLEARLIGRDEELSLLVQTLNRVEAERRPALVTIIGSAGVGKSRLALEVSRSAAGRSSVTWRKGRCLAYGNVSYSALAEAVKAECGVLEDDPPETVADKATRAVEELFGSRDAAPLIEALVGSGLEHAFTREDLFDAWRGFLERMASRGPLVLVLEDIHWADDGLLDFVDHLADWAQGPLLILTLARPELLERRPVWGGGKRNYSAIYLDPLTPEETQLMLEDLLSSPVPKQLARLVVERSEGNPLFTEEIVRMLIDRRVIGDDERTDRERSGSIDAIEIPRSVQALIATRIDSLPSEEKSILQDAAVVGRISWLGAAERLSGRSRRETRDLLGRLRVKEILVQQDAPAFSGEIEFAFRHALIRDVAYGSLPKALRAAKHVEVARWAEEQAGERREDIAELLATHYAEALRYLSELGDTRGDLEHETFRWARAAGDRGLRLWQHREAVRWFRLAAELADRIDIASDERAAAWESYARAGEAVEPYATVADAFARALDLYEALGRDADAGRVEAWLAHVAFQSGDDEALLRWAGRALEHLEPLGDSRDLALALNHLGWYHHRRGRDADAGPHLRRAMAIGQETGDLVVEGRAMLSLGMVVSKSGAMAEGLRLLDAGLELARRSGDLPFLLWALRVVSEGFELVPGDYRRAEALVREGLELARKAGHVEQAAWMLGNLADYLVDQGRLDEAEAPAREGLEAARYVGEVPRIGYSLLMLAFISVLRLEVDEAERLLAELHSIIVQETETYHEGWPEVIEAFVARAKGDEAKAVDVLVDGARRHADRLEPWGGQLLLLECVRSLVRQGRANDSTTFRDGLARLAERSASAEAFLAWADGLLERDPRIAPRMLSQAAERFQALGRSLDLGRCLADLAAAERRLGEDPLATLARARDVLASCGAALFVRELGASVPAEGDG